MEKRAKRKERGEFEFQIYSSFLLIHPKTSLLNVLARKVDQMSVCGDIRYGIHTSLPPNGMAYW